MRLPLVYLLSTPMQTYPSQFRNSAGQPMALGKELASGGEGAVFASGERGDEVIKVYHRRNASALRARDDKLTAMVAMPALRAYRPLAWPQRLLYSQDGHVAGYSMRKISGVTLVPMTAPALMRRRLPAWGPAHIARVVHDLASIFHEAESNGVMIADLGLGNFIVDPKTAEVSGIDCDSYTICLSDRVFPSTVFTVELQAPEILCGKLPLSAFGPAQFRFAGALLLFSLMTGGNPFASREGLSIPEAIVARRHFIGGRGVAGGCTNDAIWQRYRSLPPHLASLSKRAFIEGYDDHSARPTFAEWRSAARNYFDALRPISTQS